MRPVDRENRIYSELADNPFDLEEGTMFSLLPRERGRLLDLGCGAGNIAVKLAEAGFTVQAADFSPSAVKRARDRGVDAREHDLDAAPLPFGDAAFDVVYCGDVIEHVFDPIGLLREARRVLRGSGTLLASVPGDLRLARRVLYVLGRSPQEPIYRAYGVAKHHTLFSYGLFRYMLETAGFRETAFRGVVKTGRSGGTVWRSRLLSRLFATTLVFAAVPVPDAER